MAISRNRFTPFHLGLAIQVYHEFGSKNLVELLNSNGLCSSYTELRSFLTSVANHEIEHINGDRYIPSGIRPIAEGGHLIQEGSYNIDINAETVDRKNTFHSLARAVFQSKSVDDLAVCAERIKRGRDRSLPIDDTTSSLTNALSFTKPKPRVEPPRRTNAFDKIKCCYNGKRSTIDGI